VCVLRIVIGCRRACGLFGSAFVRAYGAALSADLGGSRMELIWIEVVERFWLLVRWFDPIKRVSGWYSTEGVPGSCRRLEIVQRRLVETVKELPFLSKVVLVFRNDVRSRRKVADDVLDLIEIRLLKIWTLPNPAASRTAIRNRSPRWTASNQQQRKMSKGSRQIEFLTLGKGLALTYRTEADRRNPTV